MSLANLESAVEDGCRFCYLLTQGLYALVPDMKGAKAKLNLSQGNNCVEMKVMKQDEKGYTIGSDGQWPVHQFFTSSGKSRGSILVTPNSY